MAVATNASEMPGATIAMVAWLTLASCWKRGHDAPHGAEQANDIGAGGSDGGEEVQVMLEVLGLARQRDPHRPLRAFNHGIAAGDIRPCWCMRSEFG